MITTNILFNFLDGYERPYLEPLIMIMRSCKTKKLLNCLVRVLIDNKWRTTILRCDNAIVNLHTECTCRDRWKTLICSNFIKFLGKCDEQSPNSNCQSFCTPETFEWVDDEIEFEKKNSILYHDYNHRVNLNGLNQFAESDSSLNIEELFSTMHDRVLRKLSPRDFYVIFSLTSKITKGLLAKTLPEYYRPVRNENFLESLVDSLFEFHIESKFFRSNSELVSFYRLPQIKQKLFKNFNSAIMEMCVAQKSIKGSRMCVYKLSDGQIYTFNQHGVSMRYSTKVKLAFKLEKNKLLELKSTTVHRKTKDDNLEKNKNYDMDDIDYDDDEEDECEDDEDDDDKYDDDEDDDDDGKKYYNDDDELYIDDGVSFCGEFILTCNKDLILLDLVQYNGKSLVDFNYVDRLEYARRYFNNVISNLSELDVLTQSRKNNSVILKYKYSGIVEYFLKLHNDVTVYKLINTYTGYESIIQLDENKPIVRINRNVLPIRVSGYRNSLKLVCYKNEDYIMSFAIQRNFKFYHFMNVHLKSVNRYTLCQFYGNICIRIQDAVYAKCFVCKVYFDRDGCVHKIEPSHSLTLFDCNTIL